MVLPLKYSCEFKVRIISIKDALTHKELTILIMVSNNAVAESSPIFLLLLAGQCLQMQSIWLNHFQSNHWLWWSLMVLQSLLYLIGFCWDCSCTSSGIPEQPSAHRSPGTHSHFRLFCLVPAIISHQDQINMHIMIGLRYWFLRRHFPNYKNGRFDFCEGLAFVTLSQWFPNFFFH